jgi:beta-glucanase (GH16 family)
LVFADEFTGLDGSPPSSARWGYDLGGGGWGNSELQAYTSRPVNVRQEGGNLVIEARKEVFRVGNVDYNYTSSRIKSQNRYSRAYGRFEARIKLPIGQGIWSAFWLLGANFPTVGWPDCGEIDIMENIGSEPSITHASAHGPGYSGVSRRTAQFRLSSGLPFSNDFHIFAIEWSTNEVLGLVDEKVFWTLRPLGLPPGTTWVFDHPFFIILNVAVGGGWPGDPSPTTVFPQRMLVDYVRVYSRIDAPEPTLEVLPSSDTIFLTWSGDFPHGLLYRTTGLSAIASQWVMWPSPIERIGSELRTSVTPGFYRLRIRQ